MEGNLLSCLAFGVWRSDCGLAALAFSLFPFIYSTSLSTVDTLCCKFIDVLFNDALTHFLSLYTDCEGLMNEYRAFVGL
jgi:hypothetical protein